jgi:shikimate kinase
MGKTRFCTIILVGPKHAGKTSAASALAKLWGGAFIDLDELIEKQTGKSPRDLYTLSPQVLGEAETGALKTLLGSGDDPVRIIAAGGGIIDNHEAVDLLKTAEGIRIVYLEVSAETAWERIRLSKGGLPPFLNTDNPRDTHKKLHLRRGEAYKKISHIVIPADHKSPDRIGREIYRILNGPELPGRRTGERVTPAGEAPGRPSHR